MSNDDDSTDILERYVSNIVKNPKMALCIGALVTAAGCVGAPTGDGLNNTGDGWNNIGNPLDQHISKQMDKDYHFPSGDKLSKMDNNFFFCNRQDYDDSANLYFVNTLGAGYDFIGDYLRAIPQDDKNYMFYSFCKLMKNSESCNKELHIFDIPENTSDNPELLEGLLENIVGAEVIARNDTTNHLFDYAITPTEYENIRKIDIYPYRTLQDRLNLGPEKWTVPYATVYIGNPPLISDTSKSIRSETILGVDDTIEDVFIRMDAKTLNIYEEILLGKRSVPDIKFIGK